MALSSDGRTLAVGGPYDDDLKGATWIFVFDGTAYQQLGPKLVGIPPSVVQGMMNKTNLIQESYTMSYLF